MLQGDVADRLNSVEDEMRDVAYQGMKQAVEIIHQEIMAGIVSIDNALDSVSQFASPTGCSDTRRYILT